MFLTSLLKKFINQLYKNYGKFIKPKYSLNIERRAYSLGAFYDVSNESLGIQFNIFNFDYSGIPEKF